MTNPKTTFDERAQAQADSYLYSFGDGNDTVTQDLMESALLHGAHWGRAEGIAWCVEQLRNPSTDKDREILRLMVERVINGGSRGAADWLEQKAKEQEK